MKNVTLTMKNHEENGEGETPAPFVRYFHEYWELIREISCEHSLNVLESILFCRIFILVRRFSVQKNSQIPEGWSGTLRECMRPRSGHAGTVREAVTAHLARHARKRNKC